MYAVKWLDEAIESLMYVTAAATNVAGVLKAVDRTNALLSVDPECEGSTIHEGLRRIVIDGLVVLYEVDRAAQVVSIAAVGRVQE